MLDPLALVIMLVLISINLSLILIAVRGIKKAVENTQVKGTFHIKINGRNITLQDHDDIYINRDDGISVNGKRL